MEFAKLKTLSVKQKLFSLLVAACKTAGLYFAILTVHLVAHLLEEVFDGEPVYMTPAILKILGTILIRMILIKIGTDTEIALSEQKAAEAAVLPAVFYAAAAPVILFIAVFEVSRMISIVLMIAAVLFMAVSFLGYRKAGKDPGHENLMNRLFLDLGVCCGTALGIILILPGIRNGSVGVSGAFIILLHAADFFRPARQAFRMLYEQKKTDSAHTEIADVPNSAEEARMCSESGKNVVLADIMIRAAGWMGHILIPLLGSIGIIKAVSGAGVTGCIMLICAAAVFYSAARAVELCRKGNRPSKNAEAGPSLSVRILTSVFIGIIIVPAIVRVHPFLGIQLFFSYIILGTGAFFLGQTLGHREGLQESLTEGLSLVLDTLMLISALWLLTNGTITSGSMFVGIVALVCSAGPFIEIGEQKETVIEEEAEITDSF